MNDERDFQNLANRYMDGLATAEEVQRLDERLRSDAAARKAFAELLNLDSALWALTAEERPPAKCSVPLQHWGDTPPVAVAQSANRTSVTGKWRARAALAAGLCAAAMLASVMLMRSHDTPPEKAIARLNDAVDAVWADAARAPAVGDRLGTERLELKSGTLKITINSGVVLTLVGPAEAQFVNSQRLRVDRGRVTAEVGPNAKGFSIETNHAHVVDFGTKFGVDASVTGHTDVIVLQGEVRVYQRTDKVVAAAPVTTLTTGEAVRVDKSRRLFRIVNVTSHGSEEDWSTQGLLSQDSIITAVRDNLEGGHPSLRNFYRIVPGGMCEDARTYADYSHEWNGLDATGIPDWLVGADLIQTFNADHVNWWMQITVTVSRPCVLYVLVDRRNPPPKWLRERFIDTGANIGWEYVDPPNRIFAAQGTGKGRHLFPFGIWKLEVLQAGEVNLGPPYFQQFHDESDVRPNFMYGIAAKALK